MIAPEDRITDELHKTYSFNCLTAEEFKELQEMHELGDEFSCECDECGVWYLGDGRRCSCGNRRCYLIADQYNGERFFRCDVD